MRALRWLVWLLAWGVIIAMAVVIAYTTATLIVDAVPGL